MKVLLLSICIIFLNFSVVNAEWTATDTAFQLAYTTLHVVDWGQTLDIAKNPDKWHETNPILGKHPSIGRVNTYFITTLIGHTFISYILPKNYRRIWQCVWIGIEGGYVAHNYHMGIRVNF